MRQCVLFPMLLLVMAAPVRAEKRPMEIKDLFRMQRLADPQISPDGKWVVYQVAKVNLDENRTSTNLWLAATDGKTPPRQLTNTNKADRHPRWSPDSSRIVFESTRGGEPQLWTIDIAGGEARQLTTLCTGATNGIWSPDGAQIAFVSAVYPQFSDKPFKEADALNKKRLEEAAKSPVKARVFTRLFFRHWDEYVEDKRNHLFVVDAKGGDPRDATPGDRDCYPTSTTFSVGDEFVFSPNSKFLVFTAAPSRDEAWSTNYEICRVPVNGGTIETLTEQNPAADGSPRFSPDGTRLAYRSQQRAGYEADKWDLRVVTCDANGTLTGEPAALLGKLDLSAHEFAWYGNTDILFNVDQNGERRIRRLSLTNLASRILVPLTGASGSLSTTTVADPPLAALSNSTLYRPPEVFAGLPAAKPGGMQMISHANDALLAELDLPQPESAKIEVEGGTMQMWLLKPPGFDPNKIWPVAYLVHGGPQSAWENAWSFRWNPELWAAQGYIIALPNPRGSVGFGKKFVDEISGDWGGKCYNDLLKGIEYVEALPYVDKDRLAAAGGSFGGYMMNWFAVNTGKFKTLITHCSVWNFESMWGTTDELWFDEFEHGGLPWEKPGEYAKFSPHKRAANLGKFKTPMLIIHNDLDFRCPIGQGHELFSTLQRLRVPSRFVNFPDEGHWVLKPKNSERWHEEVFAWLKKYCPPGGK